MIDILKRHQLVRDYKETFETAHGQRVLRHILEVSGATKPKFTTDADQLRWNEAQRHLALSIFRQVHTSLDKLPDFIAEEMQKTEQHHHEST